MKMKQGYLTITIFSFNYLLQRFFSIVCFISAGCGTIYFDFKFVRRRKLVLDQLF